MSQTLNHQPSTRNPKPQTLNPKPQTPNPRPQTLNPGADNCTACPGYETVTLSEEYQLILPGQPPVSRLNPEP